MYYKYNINKDINSIKRPLITVDDVLFIIYDLPLIIINNESYNKIVKH